MILDLFAGPGGWSEGLRMLSPDLHADEIGLEWDAAACATRAAAGHRTIQTDIATYPTKPFAGKVTGLIASPPCQDFSLAGKGAGIDGERGQLVREVMRWAVHLEPEWIACEQVPPVLPIWNDYAAALRAHGYSTWTGVLNAADYGVPQTRKRAFLLASRVRPALPPEPTHAKEPEPSLFGPELLPWVSMADALGLAHDVVLRHNMAEPDRPRDDMGKQPVRCADGSDFYFRMPATAPVWTISGSADAWRWEQPARNQTGTFRVSEALVLQSFPAGYPLKGNKDAQFQQVGNAVPPLLAARVLAAVTGVALRSEA